MIYATCSRKRKQRYKWVYRVAMKENRWYVNVTFINNERKKNHQIVIPTTKMGINFTLLSLPSSILL